MSQDPRAVFDHNNMVNEQELLTVGEKLAAYVTGKARGSARLAKGRRMT